MLDKDYLWSYNVLNKQTRAQKQEEMKMTTTEYREMLINGILDYQTKGQFTLEELKQKPIRTLEIIYDNVE